jgi:regulator of protease activity HflC (stomatin/prohibitin superfamily)
LSVNEVAKAVVAHYTASELLIKRDQVSNQIKSLLTARAREFNIIINEVSIVCTENLKLQSLQL